MKEEPELDSSLTGRFLVELFARKKVVPAEKMISNMRNSEYECVVCNCEFAAISLPLGVQG